MAYPMRTILERNKAIVNQQLEKEVSLGHIETGRFLYGNIAGMLNLALCLDIIDASEADRRFQAVQDKFYSIFEGR